MDTDYFEEVAFRACRYDLSSLNQSVSCCDCNKSVKCEWGVLENSSSPQPVCQLWTSQLGLYQFTIYTGQFPCYLNIGTPFEIHERLSHERSSDYHIEIVYSITTSVFTAMILLLLVLIVIVARYKSTYIYVYVCYICIYVCFKISLSTVVLNSRDRHEKHGNPLLHASITRFTIKTYDSESRGQEEVAVYDK